MNYETFRSELKRRTRRDLTHPEDHCPDTETLASYVTGELDEQTKQHVGVHVAFCKNCFQEVSALEGLERRSYWQDLVQTLRTVAIDLCRMYGPGALVGSIRVLEESPAFALKGAQDERLFKILEVPVGENRYSVEVGIKPDGPMDCTIGSVETPASDPLDVTVHSETGEILYATKTTAGGESRFAIPEAAVPRELCVFMFALGDRFNNLVIQMPEPLAAEG